MDGVDDGPWQWWDDPVPDEASSQTRDKSHPDGFSFLLPPSDEFWKTWLQFTSKELASLNFYVWLFQRRSPNG